MYLPAKGGATAFVLLGDVVAAFYLTSSNMIMFFSSIGKLGR